MLNLQEEMLPENLVTKERRLRIFAGCGVDTKAVFERTVTLKMSDHKSSDFFIVLSLSFVALTLCPVSYEANIHS